MSRSPAKVADAAAARTVRRAFQHLQGKIRRGDETHFELSSAGTTGGAAAGVEGGGELALVSTRCLAPRVACLIHDARGTACVS